MLALPAQIEMVVRAEGVAYIVITPLLLRDIATKIVQLQINLKRVKVSLHENILK